MADISSPVLLQQNNGYSADSDYCSQGNEMDSDETTDVKPETSAFELALAAATAPSENRKPKKEVKEEECSDEDDVPWAQRIAKKEEVSDEDDDDIPWAQRMAKETPSKKKSKKKKGSDDDDDEYTPVKANKKVKKEEYSDDEEDVKPKKKEKRKSKKGDSSDEDEEYGEPKKKKAKKEKETKSKEKNNNKKVKKEEAASPTKRKKKEEEPEEVWEWWKEDKKPDGVKWNTLSHKGPLFAPPYEPLPDHVQFKYEGKVMKLSEETEEVATFYGRMIDHDYVEKDQFNKNFFKDWRKVMTAAEREKIVDLTKCDFRQIDVYFKEQSEKRKAMTKEQKLKIKEEKEAETKIYGIAVIDGHKQKVANFRIEPPGLFRGRGGHPKMGMLKRRVRPEDVIINCGKGSEVPEAPKGHKWKEIRHDTGVTWLCSWTENVLGQNKYIMLNPSSKIKGEKDHEKYETARRLKKHIRGIRNVYQDDWKSKEMRVRQRAVALYFIDKLALRAGNEKDVDEAADTVGCCSLRCEHINLHEKLDGKDYVVEFDFLGKDSIRYYNKVPVEKRVFKNLQIFKENKEPGDDLFDRLDTSTLNEHLRTLMPGLTVKVFRTYNASITLQEQLDKLTNPNDNLHQKLLSYNRANRQVAILCNHQRAIPKSHEKSMENLENKIKDKKTELSEAKKELEKARGANKDKLEKRVQRLKEQYKKLKINRTDRDENKTISLGTSKLNYLDPRITVAWCKKNEIPLEKVFNKTHREKFRWAIDMVNSTDEEYIF